MTKTIWDLKRNEVETYLHGYRLILRDIKEMRSHMNKNLFAEIALESQNIESNLQSIIKHLQMISDYTQRAK